MRGDLFLTFFSKTTLDKKWGFPLRISSIDVTKSAVSCGFGHIYWKNLEWKTSFFVYCKTLISIVVLFFQFLVSPFTQEKIFSFPLMLYWFMKGLIFVILLGYFFVVWCDCYHIFKLYLKDISNYLLRSF